MKDIEFRTQRKNPLTELSELRLEIEPADTDFELKCLLIFGKMQYEHNGREYEVGVSRAHLRLSLEGCETTLGTAFGESVLEPVVEVDGLEIQSNACIGVSASSSSNTGTNATVKASAGVSGVRKQQLRQTKVHLPVVAGPNNSWKVEPKAVTGGCKNMIEGTAIPSARLGVLRRKQGGNRMAIIGEVQISKSAIIVSAKGGNRLNKTMVEWRNKDVIVSLILKKAIQREAASSVLGRSSSTVAFSRSEVSEE